MLGHNVWARRRLRLWEKYISTKRMDDAASSGRISESLSLAAPNRPDRLLPPSSDPTERRFPARVGVAVPSGSGPAAFARRTAVAALTGSRRCATRLAATDGSTPAPRWTTTPFNYLPGRETMHMQRSVTVIIVCNSETSLGE